MCTFALNIHVALSYVYSLILPFKKNSLFCSAKYKHAQRTCLGKRLQAFSSRTCPLLPAFLRLSYQGFRTCRLQVAVQKQNSSQIPQIATSFLIKYLFSGKVHVWSVYNISHNLLSSMLSIKILWGKNLLCQKKNK